MIEINECLDQSEKHCVYRALLHNQEVSLWMWNTPRSLQALRTLMDTTSAFSCFPTFRQIVEIQGQLALVGSAIRGAPLTAFTSSLSPKTLYDIAGKVFKISQQTKAAIHYTSAIWLQEDGSILVLPSDTEADSKDVVLIMGLWLLGHLSDQNIGQVYTFAQQNRVTDYTRYLEFCLRSVKPGLPNTQWNQNAAQSLLHMTAFHVPNRWPVEEAIRILSAYKSQAIGQDLETFCQRHQRHFTEFQARPGALTGEVHPHQEYQSSKPPTPNIFIESKKDVLSVAILTLIMLHLGTYLTLELYTLLPEQSQTSTEECCSLTVEHSGVKSIRIQNTTTELHILRSQRFTEHQPEPSQYTLEVQTIQREKVRANIEINTNSHLECNEDSNKTGILCELNNRRIEWE